MSNYGIIGVFETPQIAYERVVKYYMNDGDATIITPLEKVIERCTEGWGIELETSDGYFTAKIETHTLNTK